ncbi:MAG: T9SS type A sorting domain-containing protein [Ignavibacteriaceae bacterium]
MKNLFFLLLLLSTVAFYPQSFHSLDGIENQNDQTELIYRLGSDYYPFNQIYKLNTNDLTEEMIMEAYNSFFPGGQLAKAVWDFEFFPDYINFMNVGYQINPDNHSYIARNDSIVFGGIGGYERVDISKQDPQKVFVFVRGPVARSFDGGFTFPMDSMWQITDYYPISVADFDDNILFGINFDNQLVKNAEIVDTAKIFFNEYTKILYDVNEFHIYRVNKTYGGYAFKVSNNKGNAFTWSKTYQSENPFFITIDPSNSGLVYLTDGRKIYKSTNNGYNFTQYKSLVSKIVGIYKKPGSDDLYAATESTIYRITPDSTFIIKSLPLSPDVFEWFPQAIGNHWVFSSYYIEDNWGYPPTYHFAGTKFMDVVNDTIIDSNSYFILENNILNQFVFEARMFLRVDSISGEIFRYWDTLNSEFPFHRLNAEPGDTIYYPPNLSQPYYILTNEDELPFWNTMRYIRGYMEYFPCSCGHILVKGLGLGGAVFYEFGGSEDNLKGAVIDGVVYGDTTFVVSVEDEQETIPSEFKLFQNYPNPFNPVTKIKYSLPNVETGHAPSLQVTLKVYDVLGKEAATLANEEKQPGVYEVEFNSAGLASGVYYYQLKAGSFVETKKMVVIK